MSDDEDDYVAFGVALKPLEEKDNIRKKPIAVEEQIVRDVNGIRRFHGAFTGGFSAGHFNTVNTPQGWYPKHFKSSREAKSDKAEQKPEDFMDDEDLGAFGFAAQALKTKSSFQGGAETSDSVDLGSRKSVIPLGGLLEQLVRPAKSTVGETLLMRQGWKPGQGVGPKATKLNKKARLSSHIKTYGCSMPNIGDDISKEEDDLLMKKYKEFLFAPDEIPLNIANPKDNFFGIGYSGLDKSGGIGVGGQGVLGGAGFRVKTSLSLETNARKKFSISGEAFGVGADEEDDDMEVYNNKSDMAQYDFSLDVRGEDRSKRREEKGSRWNSQKETLRGLDQVEGFCPATSLSMIKKHYTSPQIPANWRPRPGLKQKQSRFSPVNLPIQDGPSRKQSRWDQKATGSNPTVEQRKAKLFPDECNNSNTEGNNEKDLITSVKSEELPEFLQEYQPDQNKGVFKPFAKNEAKQLRYEQYLVCVANSRGDALPLLQPRSMTEWEKERERVEFERASMLFKPMRGVIGSRFVSAGESEDVDNGGGGLHGEADDGGIGSARKAADMKMFGQLTRTVEEWHPAKLLCVRFNVAHPFGDYTVVGTREKAKRETGVTNVFAMVGVDEEKVDGDINSSQNEVEEENTIKDEPTDNVEVDKEEEAVQLKPPADLFKAIFVDSDSEEDTDTERTDSTSATDVDKSSTSIASPKPANHLSIAPVTFSGPKPWEQKEGNILRNKEPARGIFANIDLDNLNRRIPDQEKIKDEEDKVKAHGKTGLSVANQTVRTVLGIRTEQEEESEEEFGPRLPPTMVKQSIVISSDSEDGRWIDKGNKKKHKDKERRKKKQKDKDKKKHKDKKEVKKKRKFSSDYSSDDRGRRKDRNEHKHKKRRRYSSSS